MFRSKSVRRMSSRPRHTPRTFRPRLEALEDRTLLSTPGSLDLTFGGGGTGKALWRVGNDAGFSDQWAEAIAIQNDGKIITAFTVADCGGDVHAAVARFEADGQTLDLSFAGTGYYIDPGFKAGDVALQSDGKIVLTGVDASAFFVTRLNPNGSLDESFVGGRRTFSFGDFLHRNPSVAIREVDPFTNPVILPTIVVAGTIVDDDPNTEPLETRLAVARLHAAGPFVGGLDYDFGDQGKQTTYFSERQAEAYDVAIQNDGRIVVVGSISIKGSTSGATDTLIARYEPQGLDPTFNENGWLKGYGFVGRGVAIQADGQILVAGSVNQGNHSRFALARYNESDGSLEWNQSTNITPSGASNDHATSIAIVDGPLGRIVVGGYTEFDNGDKNFALARYRMSGISDGTFSDDGVVATDISGFNDDDLAVDIALQGGKVVAVGRSNVLGGPWQSMARYHNQIFVHLDKWVAELGDDAIALIGSSGDDAMEMTDKGGGAIELRTPDGRHRLALFGISTITVMAGDGDDKIVVRQLPPGSPPRTPPSPNPFTIVFDAGLGTDKLELLGNHGDETVTGNGGNVLNFGTNLNVQLHGQGGHTTGVFSVGLEDVTALLGDGDDVCDIQGGEGLGDLHTLRIDGGAGMDKVAIAAEILGGADDVRGMPAKQLRFEVLGGADDDNVQVDVTTTDVAVLDILLDGEAGNDELSLFVVSGFNPQADPPEPLPLTRLKAVVDGGAGDDRVQADLAASGVRRLDILLGGEAGNDQLSLLTSVGLLPAVQRPESIVVTTVVDGGPGDDVLSQVGTIPFDEESIPPDPPRVAMMHTITAGDGNDQVLFEYSEAYIPLGSKVDLRVNLGSGVWDLADLYFDQMVLNGTLGVRVDGGNGAQQVSITEAGKRGGPTGKETWDIRLGNGDNALSVISYGGMLEGRKALSYQGGTGADDVSVLHDDHVLGTETMDITLGNGHNSATVQLDGQVDGNSTTAVYGGTAVDELTIGVGGGVGPDGKMTCNLFPGQGANSALLQLQGTFEGSAAFSTRFGTGADTWTGNLVGVHVLGRLAIDTDMGNGINHWELVGYDMALEGTLQATVRGGLQADRMAAFLGGDVASGGVLDVRMLGSDGANHLRFDFVGRLDGDLRFGLTGGRHNDVLAAVARLHRDSMGTILGQVRGGAGNDHLTFDVLDAALVEILAASIVDGGLGFDTCHAHPKVRVVNCELQA